MADYPSKRADESDFLDNDPFAELMRMAGDDRPKAPDATFSANESFDIDLERELLGDFEPDNDAGPDQGQSRMADHWTRDQEPEPAVDFAAAEPESVVEPQEPEAYESAAAIAEEPVDFEPSFDDFDLDLEMADDGPHLPLSVPASSDEPTFSYAETPDETVLDARVHALFADAPIIEPEAEDADAFEMEFDDAFAISEPVAEPGFQQPEPSAEPDLSNSEETGDLEIDLEFGDFSDDAQLAAVHEADALAPAVADSIIAPRWEPEDESAYAADLEWEPGSDTVVAPALSFGDDQQPARQWSAADLRAEGPVEPMAGHVPFEAETSYEEERSQAFEPEPAASPFALPTHSDEPQSHRDTADSDDVLGDIENWLNADATAPNEQVIAEPVPPSSVFEPVPEPIAAIPAAPVSLSLEDELNALLGDDPVEPMPAVQTAYGYAADVAFADAAEPAESGDAMPALDEFDLTLDLDFNEPEAVDHEAIASHDFIAEDEFDAIADPAQWRDADDEIEQPAAAYDEAPEEVVASGNLVEEPVTTRRSGPFAMLAALAPAISRFGGGDRAAAKASEPAVAAAPLFGMARANRPEAPDIETVDVDDLPVALADDLDIPELHEPEEVAPLFSPDDLEAELDVAFGSLAPEEEPVAGSATASSATQPEAVPLQGTFAGGDYAYTAAEYTAPPADDDFGDVAFDYDPDAEELDEPLPPKDGLRRKYFILGGVAAVALIAGLGYFAFGVPAGDGLPAIVRADSDPVRVRPENRGGATVPNQDSSAYRRSTGATGVPGAGQEQLVTTAEEPVDVRAAVAPAPQVSDDFPMVGMEEIPMLDEEAAQMLASVKDDDRLSGAEESVEDGLISIAPRRVRTMVVRPDGTLVSRDEVPAPATLAEQIAATNVAAAQGEGTAVPLVQDAQPIGSLVPQAGQIPPQTGEVLADDPVMPEQVGVVPSRPQARPEAAATEAPVQVASTAPAATATAAPVQAATAPVGEWSMQIASQPTAEGAQTAYQDLARRYGNVLEGKGVNIVRAEIEGMGTFYRVRIPATTRDDAVRLCTEFKSAGGSCFVSR